MQEWEGCGGEELTRGLRGGGEERGEGKAGDWLGWVGDGSILH